MSEYKDGMEELIEELAALEHQQWMEWANTIIEEEDLSQERVDRWEEYMIPYEDLDDSTKKHDRKWALKIIRLLSESEIVEIGPHADKPEYVIDLPKHVSEKELQRIRDRFEGMKDE